jgi:hypothetical protein
LIINVVVEEPNWFSSYRPNDFHIRKYNATTKKMWAMPSLVARRQQNGAGAKIAVVRAAAARLHCQAVVFGRVQQIEPRHRRIAQIKLARRRLRVERLEATVLEIAQHLRPEWFPLAYHYSVAVLPGFFG